MSRKYSIKTLTRYKNQEICRRKYFAKTFTRDENHKNIEKHNDKPLKETRISKKSREMRGNSHTRIHITRKAFEGALNLPRVVNTAIQFLWQKFVLCDNI